MTDPLSTHSDTTGREWIAQVVEHCKPYELEQCMGDLLDRAEFAEEMARRDIVERLNRALNEMPWRDVPEDVREILVELEGLRWK